MLNLYEGQPIAMIIDGKYKGDIIYLQRDKEDNDGYAGDRKIDLKKNSLVPLMNPDERSVNYVAGPSGSGKSSYAAQLAKSYKKLHPKKDIYIFSRTDVKNDPAFKKLNPHQVELDESLLNDPIDIAEIESGSLIIFDDCNTIQDKEIRTEIDRLICDIMEVGRKMNISLILTNHLVNPNERKFSRTVMNEMQNFTFFPSSGSAYQIKYCLKNYFGLSPKQIDEALKLPSRWVTIMKNYPMCVLYEHGCYLV